MQSTLMHDATQGVTYPSARGCQDLHIASVLLSAILSQEVRPHGHVVQPVTYMAGSIHLAGHRVQQPCALSRQLSSSVAEEQSEVQ